MASTTEAVDAAGAVDAQTRPPRLGNRCAIPTSVPPFSSLDRNDEHSALSRLRARKDQRILEAAYRWPLFKRSSVAAFQRSVTRCSVSNTAVLATTLTTMLPHGLAFSGG